MINLTNFYVFQQEQSFKNKLKLLFKNQEIYGIESLSDLKENLSKVKAPFYKRGFLRKKTNPLDYEAQVQEIFSLNGRKYAIIAMENIVWGIHKQSEEIPYLSEIEIRDGTSGKIKLDVLNREIFLAYLENSLRELEIEVGKKDPLFKSIDDKIQREIENKSRDQIIKELTLEEKIHFDIYTKEIIHQVIERYQPLLTSQFLAPPTTEGREYLNLNAGKTNLTFEQGIIFAYCPKTKKFMFVKPNQDDK